MTKLRQIILNVLSNACKFTANGRIAMGVDRRFENAQEWIVFSITDTGIGMSAAQMEHLFEEFSASHGGKPRTNTAAPVWAWPSAKNSA